MGCWKSLLVFISLQQFKLKIDWTLARFSVVYCCHVRTPMQHSSLTNLSSFSSFASKFFPRFFPEVGQDGPEGLRGGLRLASRPHLFCQPRPSAAVPSVRALICGREREWHGLHPLLTSRPPLLSHSGTWIHGQILFRYIPKPFLFPRQKHPLTKWSPVATGFNFLLRFPGLSLSGMYEHDRLNNNTADHKVSNG